MPDDLNDWDHLMASARGGLFPRDNFDLLRRQLVTEIGIARSNGDDTSLLTVRLAQIDDILAAL